MDEPVGVVAGELVAGELEHQEPVAAGPQQERGVGGGNGEQPGSLAPLQALRERPPRAHREGARIR